MKSFRGTLVLALVIGALLAYAAFDYNLEQKKTTQETAKEKLFDAKVEDLVEAKVERKSETFVLKKSENKWHMTQPVDDLVEPETINEYLDSLALEKANEIAKPNGGEHNWAEYFLDQPVASFELIKKDGSKISFSISNQVSFDGNYYIRRGDALLLGSPAWARTVEKGSRQLRDKRLLRHFYPVNWLAFNVDSKDLKDKFTLVRQEEKWVVEGDSIPIDSSKVERFIDDLKDIRGLEFSQDDQSAAALKKTGLEKPNASLELGTVSLGKQPFYTAKLGHEEGGGVYAKTSDATSVLRLSPSDAAKLRQGRMDFRDGKAPFKVDIEQIRQVRVKDAKGIQTFSKQGEDWKLEDAKPEQKIVSNNLQKVFEKISTLEAKEFFPASQKVGAVKHSVDFRDAAGKSLLTVDLADEFTPQTGRNQNSSLTYVRLSSSKEVFAVSSYDLQQVPFDQLIDQPQAPQTDETQKSEKK